MTSSVSAGGRPTIAAVIVNYNYARYLPDALDSVLGQDRPFDEIIAVNDGSTDRSMEVLAGYRNRLTVLDIPNGGQLGACRAGLAATTTDYVYFLDADDYAHPQLVSTVLAHLAGSPVKVQFQLEGVNPAVADLGSIFPTFPEPYDAARMRSDNRTVGFYICPPTSGNVYHCGTLRGAGLEMLDQRDFIDGPATLAMPYLGEVRSINTVLAAYRVHGANHSQWSEPTPELLAHEVEWFDRRWEQTARVVGSTQPPFGDRRPFYVLERELMIAALDACPTWAPAVRALRTLPATNVVAGQKVMLAVWAIGLTLPVRGLRRSLVRARRSASNRPRGLQWLIRSVLRGRRNLPPRRR